MYELLPYLGFALGLNALFFIPAYFFQTDKLTDLTYALTFIIMAQYALYLSNYNSAAVIIATLVTLWGVRLGCFLFLRVNKMKKDKRFDSFRKNPLKFGQFFVLQGLAAWIILIPSLWLIIQGGAVNYTGVIIWTFGFLFESIADHQKYQFKLNKKNKGKFIKEGLWSLSRHPNYFGEITCWVGIYIAVFESLLFTQQLIALISPLAITYVIVKATGLPQLEAKAEKKWGKTKAYKAYKRNTPILIPKLP